MILIKNGIKNIDSIFENSMINNSFYLFGVLIAGSFFGFVSWVIISNIFDEYTVGVATALISVCQFITGLSSMGLGVGFIRYHSSIQNMNNLINSIIVSIVFFGVTTLTIFIVSVEWISPILSQVFNDPLLIILTYSFIIFSGINSFVLMIFQACRKSKYAFYQVVFTNAFRIIMLPSLCKLGLTGIIMSLGVPAITVFFVNSFYILPKIINKYKFKLIWSKSQIINIFPYSFGNHVIGYLIQAPIQISPLIVLEQMGPFYSAQLYFVWMLINLIISPSQAISGAFFAEGSDSISNVKKITNKIIKKTIAITIVFGIITLAISPIVIYFFGKNFNDGFFIILLSFVISCLLVTINKILFSFLQILKRIKDLFWVSIISFIIFYLTLILSINYIGLFSVSWAWFVSQLIIFLLIRNKKYFYTLNSNI